MSQRPKALRGIVGHAGAVRLLAKLVDHDHLPHALILEGPAGCGRRTLAIALATALLCPQRQAGDACGSCAHCVQAHAGNHPDLSELPGRREAPGGLPVEEARAVAEGASSSPLLGVAKAIIIPDAERLRGASANALLKILEEPPPRTTLILTATSAAGLLGTIRSRAQVFRLQALSEAEAERVLGLRGALSRERLAVPPFAPLDRILAGFDLGAVAEVVAALPSKAADDGDEEARTPAAVQRACLRQWLVALNDRVRSGLRSPDVRSAGRALDQLERLHRALADLDRNHPPRLVLEALALGK
jgi:DNA polymerase III delta' subunit